MREVNRVVYLTDEYYLHSVNDVILVDKNGSNVARIPSNMVEEIILFGNTTLSTHFLKFCAEKNIIVACTSVYGNLYGMFYGKDIGNVLLRKAQYDNYTTDKALKLTQNIIIAKLKNSRNVLLRAIRDANNTQSREKLRVATEQLYMYSKEIIKADSFDTIRGIEGLAATAYFQVFDSMLKTLDDKMLFCKRTRRPSENNCNSLLSLFYTLYAQTCTSALRAFGLDANCGYFHTLRPGRPSLALDLIEEFRACIVDKFVINLINRKQVQSAFFEQDIVEGIHLKEKELKLILKIWEEYKDSEVEHSLFNTRVKIRELPYVQAQLLAKYIRGEIADYPPYLWR